MGRFNIKKIKVLDYSIVRGRECLESLRTNKKRRYPLNDVLEYTVYTNYGNLHVKTLPGFEFDGRSGPKIIDWYVPNLGTLEERLTWHAHDCNGYGQDLSFSDTNILMFAMARDMCKYSKEKASIMRWAVGLSDDWYGEPKPTEWCYKNRDRVATLFVNKVA